MPAIACRRPRAGALLAAAALWAVYRRRQRQRKQDEEQQGKLQDFSRFSPAGTAGGGSACGLDSASEYCGTTKSQCGRRRCVITCWRENALVLKTACAAGSLWLQERCSPSGRRPACKHALCAGRDLRCCSLSVYVSACSLEVVTQPRGHDKGWLLVSSATSAFVQQPVGPDSDVEFRSFSWGGELWQVCVLAWVPALPHTAHMVAACSSTVMCAHGNGAHGVSCICTAAAAVVAGCTVRDGPAWM